MALATKFDMELTQADALARELFIAVNDRPPVGNEWLLLRFKDAFVIRMVYTNSVSADYPIRCIQGDTEISPLEGWLVLIIDAICEERAGQVLGP